MTRKALILGLVLSIAWAMPRFAPALSAAEKSTASSLSSKEGELKIANQSAKKPPQAQEKKVPMVSKTVTGTVGAKSSSGMALITGLDKETQSELEMWLPFSERLGLKGYKSVKDILEGDVVNVIYEETEKGGFDRKVKTLEFEKRPKPLRV